MKHILIIDDDEDIRELVETIMIPEGYHVHAAADGVEGMKQVRANSIDLVITDIFMPKKDGLEIIRELRRNFPDVKIIAISGKGLFSTGSSEPVAQGIGAHGYLRKPFSSEKLFQKVKELMSGN